MNLSNTNRSLYSQVDLNRFMSEFSHGNIDHVNGLKKDNSKLNSMKKILLFIAVVAVIAGCSKKEVNNDAAIDIFNGYGHLKGTNPTATLWAGKTINVGSVTYGIDDDGNFTATYNLTDGWVMSESHLFAGDKADMPLNKPGNPKIGRFPYAADHDMVSTYTYLIPLAELPPCEEPGFTTAAHAVVHGPNGQEETAWRGDDFEFPGKRWGWFGTFFYNQDDNPFTVLYGTQYNTDGTLNVYLINVSTGTTTHILSEDVGAQGTNFDGTAYDDESGYFFFVDYNTQMLSGINLSDESVVEELGTLSGTASSATFYNGSYYFVDETSNDIIAVSFDSNWQIESQNVISTIPETVSIQDISMSPDGSNLYMVGDVDDGTTELITLQMASDTYATLAIPVNSNSQIAYGSDNILYVIEASEDGTGSVVSSIDPSTGIITEIDENDVIVVDPFSDLAGGPMM